MSAARGPSGKAAGGLAPAALRGLLDATPAAIGCFDHALRAVYANTAFTMTTGVQAGRVLEDEALAAEVRAMLARLAARRGGCASAASAGCRSPARCSNSTAG